MNKLFTSLLLLFVLLGLPVHQAHSQALSPALLERLQAMSPAQRQALAQRYGIDLSTISGASGSQRTNLGERGQELRLFDSVDQQLQWELYNADQDPMGADPRFKRSTTPDEEVTERFGLDLFNQQVSTFSPTDDSPISDDYVLGIGDELVVYLFGKETAEHIAQVNRDGMVTIPKLGHIAIAGQTLAQAKALISQRVASQMIGVDASISLGRLRAIGIFLAGEVATPGAYSVSATTTVTQALFQAGGVSDIGSLRNIQVKRGGETIGVFDVYDLLMSGDSSGDIRLQSGDIVFVPPYGAIVEVTGEVKRPKVYEIEGGETLGDLLEMAGGLTRDAHAELASIRRSWGEETGLPEVMNVDLSQPEALKQTVFGGDVVLVRARGEALRNSVSLKGSVYRPGTYGWQEGLRVTDLVANGERDLTLNVDMDYALVVRIKNIRQDIEVLQFNLGDALLNPGGTNDLVLQPRDQVLIFSLPQVEVDVDEAAGEFEGGSQRVAGSADLLYIQESGSIAQQRLPNVVTRTDTMRQSDSKQAGEGESLKQKDELGLDFDRGERAVLLKPVIEKLRLQARQQEPAQVVSISGAVRAEGDYPLVANSTLRGLVAAAGGLKDNAFLEAAELRRLANVGSGQMSVNYQMIDLDRIMSGEARIELASRDHLTVREIPDWDPTEAVEVSGEVRFPGTYRLQKGETLSDIIRRAGGLTEDAFVEGAMLKRKSVAERERERAKELAASIRQSVASSLLTEEVQTVALSELDLITRELESFEGQGRLLIDLPAALSGDSFADVQLFDGDTLEVPQISVNVTIVGEVKRQGTHSYNKAMSLEDYLTLSAGLTSRADQEGIYVVRANGSVETVERTWWRFGKEKLMLRPGDTIVVPVDGRYKESLVAWRDITQIIYQGAVSLAAVLAL